MDTPVLADQQKHTFSADTGCLLEDFSKAMMARMDGKREPKEFMLSERFDDEG